MKKLLLFISVFFLVGLPTFSKAETKGEDILKVRIKTNKGEIVAKLFADKVPMTVANFVNLVNRGYYDGIKFHRVVDNFMIQTGDPTGTGRGGPGYRFDDEFDKSLTHKGPGILSMANAGAGTNGSQFFITHVKTPWLDGKHSVFGEVIFGQDVVNSIDQGDAMEKVTIEGDTSSLLEKEKNNIEKWNLVLDENFPIIKKWKE